MLTLLLTLKLYDWALIIHQKHLTKFVHLMVYQVAKKETFILFIKQILGILVRYKWGLTRKNLYQADFYTN